jgi:hypothetical protein
MNHWKANASRRASAIINYNEDSKSILQDREIGRVFAEYNLVVIDGENKEHEHLIPKTKVYRYGDNRVYFNISIFLKTLKEFEI